MKKFDRLRFYIRSKTPPPTPRTVWTNPIHYLACGFGVGALPFMPGTFGTALGIFIYLILAPSTLLVSIGILVLLNLLGIWLCQRTNADFGFQDHPAACYDEMVTFPICLLAITPSVTHILLAFILFRLLDILKPPPINWIDQHIHGGIGVMLDDIVAALITLGLVHAIVYWG